MSGSTRCSGCWTTFLRTQPPRPHTPRASWASAPELTQFTWTPGQIALLGADGFMVLCLFVPQTPVGIRRLLGADSPGLFLQKSQEGVCGPAKGCLNPGGLRDPPLTPELSPHFGCRGFQENWAVGKAVVAGTGMLWWKLTLAELSFASLSYANTYTDPTRGTAPVAAAQKLSWVPGTCLATLEEDQGKCRRWQGDAVWSENWRWTW